MNKIGFIGLGNMGSMLVDRFLNTHCLQPEQILVSTRSVSTLELPVERCADNRSLAKQCKYIFICVKPREVREVLAEIKAEILPDTHLISIAACVTLDNICQVIPCKATKVIPSITSEVNEGYSLVCHNLYVSPEEAKYVELLFSSISQVKLIAETGFESGADLTSCAPGLFAAMLENFILAGTRCGDFSREETESMVIRTFYATLKLLIEKELTLSELMSKVATKGGITEEGINSINKYLPGAFDEVFRVTLQKHEMVKEILSREYLTAEVSDG